MKRALFRRIALLLSLIMVISLFAACGEDKKEKNDPVAAKTDVPADKTALPADDPTDNPTEGPTPEPTEPPTAKPTAEPLKMSITTLDAFTKEERAYNEGSDGWKFYGDNPPKMTFRNGQLVLEDTVANDFLQVRLSPSSEAAGKMTADIMDNTYAIGFYVENNNDAPVGVAFFGELLYTFDNSRIDAEEESTHQCVFYNAIFDDIECYLVDMDGNAVECEEFESEYGSRQGDGLVNIPANFKGYYVVALESLGGYTCYYAQWYESGMAETHTLEDCDYGRYRKGASVANLGFSLYCNEDSDGATYIIGDYVLANLVK